MDDVRLPTADYLLAPEANILLTPRSIVLVERKASAAELATNLGPRRARFIDQLKRMRDGWASPILALEGPLADFLVPTKDLPFPGTVVQDLYTLLLEFRVQLLFLETGTMRKRQMAGEMIAHLLWAGELTDASPNLQREPLEPGAGEQHDAAAGSLPTLRTEPGRRNRRNHSG